MTEVADLVANLSLGEAQTFRNLAVVPLIDASRGPAGYLTLDDALARGLTEITEVSEAGSVPQLKLTNRGDGQVFLLDGEELAGAKQNRILNLSILPCRSTCTRGRLAPAPITSSCSVPRSRPRQDGDTGAQWATSRLLCNNGCNEK